MSSGKHHPVKYIQDCERHRKQYSRHAIYGADTVDSVQFSTLTPHQFSVFIVALETKKKLERTGSAPGPVRHAVGGAPGGPIVVFTLVSLVFVVWVWLWGPVNGRLKSLQNTDASTKYVYYIHTCRYMGYVG